MWGGAEGPDQEAGAGWGLDVFHVDPPPGKSRASRWLGEWQYQPLSVDAPPLPSLAVVLSRGHGEYIVVGNTSVEEGESAPGADGSSGWQQEEGLS